MGDRHNSVTQQLLSKAKYLIYSCWYPCTTLTTPKRTEQPDPIQHRARKGKMLFFGVKLENYCRYEENLQLKMPRTDFSVPFFPFVFAKMGWSQMIELLELVLKNNSRCLCFHSTEDLHFNTLILDSNDGAAPRQVGYWCTHMRQDRGRRRRSTGIVRFFVSLHRYTMKITSLAVSRNENIYGSFIKAYRRYENILRSMSNHVSDYIPRETLNEAHVRATYFY